MGACGHRVVVSPLPRSLFRYPMLAARAQLTNGTLQRLVPYMPQSAKSESALARTAAPATISSKADVFVFGPSGYRLNRRVATGSHA